MNDKIIVLIHSDDESHEAEGNIWKPIGTVFGFFAGVDVKLPVQNPDKRVSGVFVPERQNEMPLNMPGTNYAMQTPRSLQVNTIPPFF